VKNYEYICRPDKKLYLHNEPSPAADVCILFDLGIVETVKGVL
jgi:hypothetical protein